MANETKNQNLNVLDEAIENTPHACSIICDINYRLTQHGLLPLVVSSSHKMMPGALGINREDLAILDTFSMSEAVRLCKLAVKIQKRGNYPYPPINVILSGNTRKGMLWVKLMPLKLKSLPFTNLYSGKHYDGKGLFIIVSDLPIDELKRGFPKLYSDVILLE